MDFIVLVRNIFITIIYIYICLKKELSIASQKLELPTITNLMRVREGGTRITSSSSYLEEDFLLKKTIAEQRSKQLVKR